LFALPVRAASRNPENAYKTPAIRYTSMNTLVTLMPETIAASGFPPTAYIRLPSEVLFQIAQMNSVTAIA